MSPARRAATQQRGANSHVNKSTKDRVMTNANNIRELTVSEADSVSGGLALSATSIGIHLPYYAAYNPYVSPLDIHSLNPQPLPPKAILGMH
jgi:hypothetical protein